MKYLHKEAHVNLTQANNEGYTPAYIAAQEGYLDILMYLHNSGADLTQGNNQGFSPLYIAATEGHPKILEYLHNVGIDLNAITHDKRTAIYLASENGHLDTVELLLKYKCNSQILYTSTAASLIESASKKDKSIQERMDDKIAYRLLLGDSEEHIQLLPQDIAEVMGHQEIVVLLKSHDSSKLSVAALLTNGGSMFSASQNSAELKPLEDVEPLNRTTLNN